MAWRLQVLDRDEIARRLQEQFALVLSDTTRSTLLDNDHCFDAFVAVLTAQEYVNCNTFDPEGMDENTLDVEGWIRVPKPYPAGERDA